MSHIKPVIEHTDPIAWSDEARAQIDAILARYPDKRSASLPLIWLAQQEFGWMSPQAEQLVADIIGQPLAEVHNVVTFYTMFQTAPHGRHHVEICRNIACWLANAPELVGYVKKKLGVESGQTTPDGEFYFEEVECLAHCEFAPAMRLDDEIIGNLTKEKIDELLASKE